MFSYSEEPVPQAKAQPVPLTRQWLGVVGEEEHIARQEAECRRKLVAERQAKLLAEEQDQARALHFMKCPKCGMQLEEVAFCDVRVDKCFSCEGLWLDQGGTRSDPAERERLHRQAAQRLRVVTQ